MKRAGAAILLLLVVVSCTSRHERQARQAELLARVEKQNEENSHPTIEAHNPVKSLNNKVSIKLERIEPSPGGMKSFVVIVTNDSASPIKRIDGQVVIKTDRGEQFQLGFEIPMKVAPNSSQEYRMLVEPRWEQADTVTESKFYITSVEPDF